MVNIIVTEALEQKLYNALLQLRGHRKHVRRFSRLIAHIIRNGKTMHLKAKMGKKHVGQLRVEVRRSDNVIKCLIEAKYTAIHGNRNVLVRISRRFEVRFYPLMFEVKVCVSSPSRRVMWKPLYRLLEGTYQKGFVYPDEVLVIMTLAKKRGYGLKRLRKFMEIAIKADNLDEIFRLAKSLFGFTPAMTDLLLVIVDELKLSKRCRKDTDFVFRSRKA